MRLCVCRRKELLVKSVTQKSALLRVTVSGQILGQVISCVNVVTYGPADELWHPCVKQVHSTQLAILQIICKIITCYQGSYVLVNFNYFLTLPETLDQDGYAYMEEFIRFDKKTAVIQPFLYKMYFLPTLPCPFNWVNDPTFKVIYICPMTTWGR